jgi:hypothetical protein
MSHVRQVSFITALVDAVTPLKTYNIAVTQVRLFPDAAGARCTSQWVGHPSCSFNGSQNLFAVPHRR